MDKLLTYLNALPADQRDAFAERAGTSVGYLRKAASAKQRIGVEICIALERESHRNIVCEDLRPDVDWAYLRAAPADSAARQSA